MTKMTKKDYYAIIKATYPTNAENYDDVIAFIDHEIEMLTRKNSSSGGRKPTAQQAVNEGIKAEILNSMVENEKYTITDMIKNFDCCKDLTNQRVSALMRQLVEAKVVERIVEKRKTYFQLV